MESHSVLIAEIADLKAKLTEAEHRLTCQAPVVNWLRCGADPEDTDDGSYWDIARERIAKMDAGIAPGWQNEITGLKSNLQEAERNLCEAITLLDMAHRSHVQKGYELNPGEWVNRVEAVIAKARPFDCWGQTDGDGRNER